MLTAFLEKLPKPSQEKREKFKDLMVIPLLKEATRKIPREDQIKEQLCLVPNDPESDKHKVTTSAFDTGSPKEWINHVEVMEKIIVGWNLTTGPYQFTLVR